MGSALPTQFKPLPKTTQQTTTSDAAPKTTVISTAPAGYAPVVTPPPPMLAVSQPAPVTHERKFPFGATFQLKALAIILRTPNVLHDYCKDIKAAYFEDPVLQNLFRIIQAYYFTYKVAPTESALLEEIKVDAKKLGFSDEFIGGLAAVAHEICTSVEIDEADYIQDRMVSFIKFRRALEVTLKMADLVDKMDTHGQGDFDQVLPLIRELNAIGSKGTQGYDFADNVATLSDQLRNSDIYSSAMKVPIGIKKFDHILDGGLGAGEIAFIVAGAGVGKSSLLLNTAIAAQQAGVNVLVVTMELKESDYALRAAQRYAGVSKEHVLYNSMRYQDRMPTVISMANKAKLIFKYFPPGRCSVDSLRSYFSQLLTQEENQGQWLVIIDYLEKMKMGGDDRRNNREDWALIGDTVNELIAFGHEFNVPIFSASQTTRSGYAKVARSKGTKHTDKDDIGASWKKVEHADVILAFDQSEIEKAAGVARLRALKVRRGKDGISVRIKDNRPTMTFVEMEGDITDATMTLSPVMEYSPRRDGELLVLHNNYDNITPYEDESLDGLIRPPQVDIEDYLEDQINSLSSERDEMDIDVVANEQRQRAANMHMTAGGVQQLVRSKLE